jgi:hypothetical protein
MSTVEVSEWYHVANEAVLVHKLKLLLEHVRRMWIEQWASEKRMHPIMYAQKHGR